ncbi:MAG: pantoate--beta-alanine ligase, partial [Planctomycetales bacterium]|nr:pantoate--beta-alanine ligase [Planctomycetales bacterium]
PTMGALHAGHLSLVQAARDECDVVAATIFVNPTQFGAGEDLDKYPRQLELDLEKLASESCDLVFAPSASTMYPAGCETKIDVGAVARTLEGESRPTHFAGVATVVMKLLNILPAQFAYFGRKDYQQTLVIQRMVEDLNVPVELRFCPIVRDPDGMAMSSRNAYLSPQERENASQISASLRHASALYQQGERSAEVIRQSILERLAAHDLRVDYVSLVRDGTVEPVQQLDAPSVVLIAARAGKTRLIDNTLLK